MNKFPDGKKLTYTYTTGFSDENLNHNLTSITDGRGNTYLVNTYSDETDPKIINYDHVVRQELGGDIIDFTYVPLEPEDPGTEAVAKTIMNDRNGNVSEHFFDYGTRLLRVKEYTGRADPSLPTTETENRPTDKLRASDPDFFETRMEYNLHSQLTRVVHPNGNITKHVYETDLDPIADPTVAGNLRETLRLPGSHTPVGDQEMIVEKFEYNDGFGCTSCGLGNNFVTAHYDGRGNVARKEYDSRGNLKKTIDRIPSIVHEYEYNEFGQMTAQVLPDNGSGHRRRDEFKYYDSGPQRGYLSENIIDATGFALTSTYEYDAVGNMVRRIDPRGNDDIKVFNELDQMVRMLSPQVETPSGLVRYTRDYFYDENNNKVREDIQNIDATGEVVISNPTFTHSYEYEVLNQFVRSTKEVDENHSIVTEYMYDGNRNRTLIRHGESTNGSQRTNRTQALYDERDLLFQELRAPGDSLQSTTQYDYDPNRNLIRTSEGIEDGAHVYESVYDSYNRHVQEIDPMGNVMSNGYDANDNLVHRLTMGELVDIEGATGNTRLAEATHTYDLKDRKTRDDIQFFVTETGDPIADGLSSSTTEYNANSQVTRVVNDNNHASQMAYDTANRLSSAADAKNNVLTYGYDKNSNQTSRHELDRSDLAAKGSEGFSDQEFMTTYEYDALNRLVSTTDNAGNFNQNLYDSRSNRTRTVDALGNVIDHLYDGLNRPTDTIRYLTADGTGQTAATHTIVTRQAWDDTSRLVGQTDDNGNTTTYQYDPLNRKVTTVYADGTEWTYEHEAHDLEVRAEDANGNVVTSQYDLLDRVLRSDISPGPGVSNDTTFEVFEYDGLSRVVSAEDDDSLVVRAYDSLNNTIQEVLNGRTTQSAFDGVGNMIECIYPSGRTITTTYDDLERKSTIQDQSGLIATYDYVGSDRVERREYGNGTRTDYTYDGITGNANAPNDFGVKKIVRTNHTRISDGSTIDDRTYAWDRMGNKVERNDIRSGGPQLNRQFEYDSVYRLIQSTENDAGGILQSVRYSLDGVGNRTNVVGGSDSGPYSLDDNLPEPGDLQVNQYTETPNGPQTHDTNGNRIAQNAGQGFEQTFEYDYANRLVHYANANSGTTADYSYDVFRRRVSKQVSDASGSRTTNYSYVDWQVCEEDLSTASDARTLAYGNGIDEILTSQEGESSTYYHSDDQSSVVALSTNTGITIVRFDYDDYGTPTTAPPQGERDLYLYTGRRFDSESGLYYYRTRYLDSKTGRFQGRDIIGIWGDPHNYGNGQTYVGCNPTSHNDPFGLGEAWGIECDPCKGGNPTTCCRLAKDNCLAAAKDLYDWRMNSLEVWYQLEERTWEFDLAGGYAKCDWLFPKCHTCRQVCRTSWWSTMSGIWAGIELFYREMTVAYEANYYLDKVDCWQGYFACIEVGEKRRDKCCDPSQKCCVYEIANEI